MDRTSIAEIETAPLRDEALARLAAFVPHAGRAYAATRNFDRGPDERTNVSVLSPFIRHRLVTETEVLGAVLAVHTPRAAEKFVAEVFWRTYWKGWLEAHPEAWTRYRDSLDARLAELAADPGRRNAYDAAVSGRTGIDAFDAWADELVRVNYLHNHARMWFASIWTFTLGLPWELGADFFMRQLLDGDAASNTLSWRWVAGLHTRGRTYAATRANIARYTGNRFALEPAFARSPAALQDEPLALRSLPNVPAPAPVLSPGPYLLVLHDDDLLGDLPPVPSGIRGVCAFTATAGRSPQGTAAAVSAFVENAARESVRRLTSATGARDLGVLAGDRAGLGASLADAAAACAASEVLVPFAPIGPARSALDTVRAELSARALGYSEFGRAYDAISWPAATRGFSNLRGRIPAILTELGIGAG